jgi:DNA-binding protein H-NS
MTTNATIDALPVRTVADEQLANNVFLIEWLVKQQQQLSLQQRLINQQQQQISAQQQEIEKLKEERDKLKNRDSKNSSVPPSSDQLKKPSDKKKRKKGKKRGPKYNHQGKTRNGFGQPDKIVGLELENCPVCGGSVERDQVAPEKVQQVAEVVEQPIEIRECRSREVIRDRF